MNRSFRTPLSRAILLLVGLVQTVVSQTNAPVQLTPSPRLQAVVDRALRATLARFADQKLQSNQVAITLVDLQDAKHPQLASHRGDQQIYPASVIKMFY